MGLFKKTKVNIDPDRLPNHVGIIMDGNGRWAQKRGLPRYAGHVAGAKVFKTIAYYARDIGIKNLTVYAFSTENWQRPQEEVSRIMKVLEEFIDDALNTFEKEKVRIRFLGDTSVFTGVLREKMDRIVAVTDHFPGLTLNIAMNYGGQHEIVHGVQKAMALAQKGELQPDELTPDAFGKMLYFDDCDAVDLIIRPSGELRLSNFLLWQSAYAEFWFSDILWPDFKPAHLDQAILEYQKRNRRFGGV
ncbi:MAG: di-trans,poly-cis-decaprenylcistransferase [Clostridia bacterium]|nr:di-trans,poly-cis-decaprenylcistransferase [Clostridia bacterium]